jgi:hypothetical protein
VVVAVELSRLLRRALLVAAVAVTGWLLSAVFAGTAGADELPGDGTQADITSADMSSGLLDELADAVGGVPDMIDGMTDRVTGLTESVIDTSGDVLPTVPDHPRDPVNDLPSFATGSGSGSVSTDRSDAVPRDEPVVTPVVPAAAPTPAPAPATVLVPPEPPLPVKAPVVAVPTTPAAPPPAAKDTGGNATEHAGRGGSEPEPANTPSAPAGSGTTVSTAHDNTGSARGTHGVLPVQAVLHPADAGFTSRSLAVDGAGRAAGLPSSSPD